VFLAEPIRKPGALGSGAKIHRTASEFNVFSRANAALVRRGPGAHATGNRGLVVFEAGRKKAPDEQLFAIVVPLGGRVVLEPEWREVLVFLDLGGLGLQIGGQIAKAFDGGEVEAATRDAETGFGLAAEILGGRHGF
jgi:hypothetical protein